MSVAALDPNERRDHQRWRGRSAMGRSTDIIDCPFCQQGTEVYVWSLAGRGKKCECGALHTNLGFSWRRTSQEG